MEDVTKISDIARRANRATAAVPRKTEEKPTEGAKAKARTRLAMAAPDAADTVIEIMIDKGNDAKDRLAASKVVLDANGIGKQNDFGGAAVQIPAQFLSACLVGIAALAGQDVSAFGDMTDLQDKLVDVTKSADDAVREEALVVDVEGEEITVSEVPPAAAALTVPRDVKHRRRISG